MCQVPFQKTLEKLYDIPIVGDIRGAGFFWGIEMVKNRETRESFNSDESEKLMRGFLSKALFDNGLYAHPLTTPPLFCCFVTCCASGTAEPTTEATPSSSSRPPSSAPRNTSTRLRSHPHFYPATTCANVTAAAPVISNTMTICFKSPHLVTRCRRPSSAACCSRRRACSRASPATSSSPPRQSRRRASSNNQLRLHALQPSAFSRKSRFCILEFPSSSLQ